MWVHVGVKMAETGGGRVQLRGNRKSGLIGQLSRRHITRDFDNKCEKKQQERQVDVREQAS